MIQNHTGHYCLFWWGIAIPWHGCAGEFPSGHCVSADALQECKHMQAAFQLGNVLTCSIVQQPPEFLKAIQVQLIQWRVFILDHTRATLHLPCRVTRTTHRSISMLDHNLPSPPVTSLRRRIVEIVLASLVFKGAAHVQMEMTSAGPVSIYGLVQLGSCCAKDGHGSPQETSGCCLAYNVL